MVGGSPTWKIHGGTMLRGGPFAYGDYVNFRLLQPLRIASSWRTLVHVVLNLPMGLAAFVPTVVLLSVSTALLCTFPLALPFIYYLFFASRVYAMVERNRVA